MSTKGLMAHKKVAEVTLNAAGKADTLTLKAGWFYGGKVGPFKLDNVEHGHKIVKEATPDPSAMPAFDPKPSRAKPSKGATTPTDQPQSRADNGRAPVERPPGSFETMPRKPFTAIIYRYQLFKEADKDRAKPLATHWLQAHMEWSADEQATHAMRSMSNHIRDAKGPTFVVWTRWTPELEQAARKSGDYGCPISMAI